MTQNQLILIVSIFYLLVVVLGVVTGIKTGMNLNRKSLKILYGIGGFIGSFIFLSISMFFVSEVLDIEMKYLSMSNSTIPKFFAILIVILVVCLIGSFLVTKLIDVIRKLLR